MKIAVIDIGTNSIRCDVRRSPYTENDVVFRDKEVIRLGRTVFDSGEIEPEGRLRLLHAFERYSGECAAQGVEEIVAVATSAMREARNGEQIRHEILGRFKVDVSLISGEREAQLIARGILSSEPNLASDVLLFDIGGGSTEFCSCIDGNLVRSCSLPLGVLRLQQTLLRKSPPEQTAIEKTMESIRKEFAQLQSYRRSNQSLVGSSGTAKAILRVFPELNAHSNIVSREKVYRVVEELRGLSIDDMLLLPGVEPKRVEILFASALLFREVVDFFDAPSVQVTDFSLRDGIYDEIRSAPVPRS